MTSAELAARLKITPQYFCDLEKGRRAPSVRIIKAVVALLGNSLDIKERWHKLGARAHGWEV